jgi:glyceraldehyde-3-phosphate dehydrogenase (NAD(P))
MIRVAVNGYNVIGRRVADAIAAQKDMELVGVAKTKPDYKAEMAIEKGYKVFAADEKGVKSFQAAGLTCSGLSRDMVGLADIVIDATPDEVGLANKNLYSELGKNAIFQGGEEHDVAGLSFVAQCNYEKAKGRKFVRVVSCNTTALCRVLNGLDQAFEVEKARVVIARRGADPDEYKKGPIDSVVLDPATIPSHHGPDVNTVLPNFRVITMALKIPTTHMHLHSLIVTVKDRSVNDSRVLDKLKKTPRVMFVNSDKDGFKSTANIVDYARELGRPRNDIYESVVWEDSIKTIDNEVYFFMAVHQEAIVIPENIDAIRAMIGKETREESMQLTDRSLGIRASAN